MKYAIGLDCGISSVGYAVMALDLKDEPCRIIKLSSRIFNAAENPKDGSSLALPRRKARGGRRRTRRHRHRIERIKHLMLKSGLLNESELSTLFSGQLSDIYMLRTKALDEKVTNAEFARILINLAERRGFKSNRKSEAIDKETGRLLTEVSENEALMQKSGWRTVGEMLYKDEKFAKYKRNKGENYTNTVSRKMIESEAEQIFSAQRRLGNAFATEENEQLYLDILLSQRPFDVGPGAGNANSPSPYAGDQIFKMIGNCTLFPKEKRAAKATYSFQMFNLWQNINHITLSDGSGNKTTLTDDERKKIYRLCRNTANVTYKRIRKELEIGEEYTFNSISYGSKDTEEVESKAKFNYLNAYHDIRKALDKYEKNYIEKLTPDELDSIGTIFTIYKSDDKIIENLKNAGIDEALYDPLLDLKGFSKHGHISIKACKELLPYLQEGMTYDKACAAAGIDFKAHSKSEKGALLPANADELDDITNPVVRRSVSQTIKVINSIIREMGSSPVYINIELARDLSKSKSERNEIEAQNKTNRAENERVKERIINEFGIRYPTGQDIVKFKLRLEQDGICPYSQKPIKAEMLFSDGYVDIDHIIPYSISFDDSYNNKVLVFSAENRRKGNKLPLEYLSGKARDNFIVWVENNVKRFAKKRNLLKEKVSEADLSGFRDRNLNDTRYLNRVLMNFITDHLEFAPYSERRKRHVMSVNGRATDYMRKRWGIAKIRENGDLHHAADAAVIACVTQSNINKISLYSQQKETKYTEPGENGSAAFNINTGEVKDVFPLPYPEFRKELEYRLSDDPRRYLRMDPLGNYTSKEIEATKPAFVSRMVNRKVTGAAHEDTIRSGKEKGYKISKVPLSKLKLKKGEIENYYNPEDDRLLYEALKARLEEFGGDGAKAFPAGFEFHKPKADGSDGPAVKKVKIKEKTSSWVNAQDGIADNGRMVRIDVFHVENDGYYFVPIYVADTVKPELPNLACVAGDKPWKPMDDRDFCFSLYANDLIKITAKKDMKLSLKFKESTLPKEKYGNEMLLYYVKAGISTASITVENHDGSYIISSLGIKTLNRIEKYTVDTIGNIHMVHHEKRMRFNKK